MKWEEFEEEAKKLGATIIPNWDGQLTRIEYKDFVFWSNGDVFFQHEFLFDDSADNMKMKPVEYNLVVAQNVPPEKMLMIMKGLE